MHVEGRHGAITEKLIETKWEKISLKCINKFKVFKVYVLSFDELTPCSSVLHDNVTSLLVRVF